METRASTVDPCLVARAYQESRERIIALATDDAASSTAVAACPGWTVRDVVAHLAAVADDWVHGRLSGPPTDEETAAQTARFDGDGMSEIVAAWADAATRLEHLADTEGMEPPLGDIACHEHDIRTALGRPGARDSSAVWYSTDRLLKNLRTPVPLRVTVEDAEYHSGPDGSAEIGLRTSRFEVLRWRTGRRSTRQLAAMDWSGDPTPLLDHLYLFGPTEVDIVE